MPQMTKRKLAISALLLLIGALIGWDIYSHQAQTFFVGRQDRRSKPKSLCR